MLKIVERSKKSPDSNDGSVILSAFSMTPFCYGVVYNDVTNGIILIFPKVYVI